MQKYSPCSKMEGEWCDLSWGINLVVLSAGWGGSQWAIIITRKKPSYFEGDRASEQAAKRGGRVSSTGDTENSHFYCALVWLLSLCIWAVCDHKPHRCKVLCDTHEDENRCVLVMHLAQCFTWGISGLSKRGVKMKPGQSWGRKSINTPFFSYWNRLPGDVQG